MWQRNALTTWPSALPEGVGGDWSGWSQQPHQATWSAARRQVFVDAVKRQYAAQGWAPPRLQDLEQGSCRVVTVGHQLVVCGGPAFLHHKVLSAIRTARGLELAWGVPVVPVFWMASEDHDWKEAARVDGTSATHNWVLEDLSIPNPVGRLATPGLDALVRAWGEDGAPASMVNDLIQDLDAVDREGGCYAQVFFRWMHRWYGDLGLVVLDPDDEALKTSCAGLWAREMRDEGVRHALEGTDAMEGPAHVRDNQLFWLGEEGRVGIVKGDSRGETASWKAGQHDFVEPSEGWNAWAVHEAARCSPGVLLRPLYQEMLLESASVILGPGEWKYWHQLPLAFGAHGVAFPALRLRDHGLVMSPELVQSGWQPRDGWMTVEQWEKWVLDGWMEAHQDVLASRYAALTEATSAIRAEGMELASELSGAGGAFEKGVDKAWTQWLKKFRRALKSQRPEAWSASQKAQSALMREGVPQDRWANWHVLAGGEVNAWNEAWMAEPEVLTTSVWLHRPET
ncbi:MAG TPA: hypothetical protein DCL98_08425 [Flavobacteriales bacterium]|nr:hypothetical protein [Flavobacteriales bacterium]